MASMVIIRCADMTYGNTGNWYRGVKIVTIVINSMALCVRAFPN
jgi:hypothetical protein